MDFAHDFWHTDCVRKHSLAAFTERYTQSGLTYTLNTLEQEWDVTLLARNHTGVHLTPEGKRLLPRVQELLRSEATLEKTLEEIKGEQLQRICIGAYPSVATCLLPAAIHRFAQRYGQIQVEVVVGTGDLLPLLDQGELQLAIAEQPESHRFRWEFLWNDWMAAAAPRDNPLSQRDSLTLEELVQYPVVFPNRNIKNAVLKQMQAAEIHPQSEILLSTGNGYDLLQMVSRGMGVTFLSGMYRDSCPENVRMIPLAPPIGRKVEQAQERFGSIDVLINNAGHGYRAALEEGEPAAVAELFQTNFFGPVELMKLVLPPMRERKYGVIVNVSSIGAVVPGLGSGYYGASKAALEAVTDSLRREVAPLGIKAFIVEPGSFRTAFYDDALRGSQVKIGDYDQTSGKTRKENIVNTHQQPGDPRKGGALIAEAVDMDKPPLRVLLGSDAVRFVTAQRKAQLEEAQAQAEFAARSDY